MDYLNINDMFSAEMERLTTGTRYEINSNSDEPTSILEGNIREILYSMFTDAHSEKLAIYLNEQQEEFEETLYSFSYGVAKYDDEYRIRDSTERVALLILDEKGKYQKQINKLLYKHNRFHRALETLSNEDRQILLDYFESGVTIEYERLNNIIKCNLKKLETFYTHEVMEAEERSKVISSGIEGTVNIKVIPSEEKRQKRLERMKKRMLRGAIT